MTKNGKNLPGDCCSDYKCIPSYCIFEGIHYKTGDKWFTDDSECLCNSGNPDCVPLPPSGVSEYGCLVNNSVVPHLHSWLEEDGCTNCTCNNGDPICTSYLCNVKHTEVPTQECPRMRCKRLCKHGYRYKNGCQTCKCKLNEKNNNAENKETTTQSNTIVKYKLLEEFMRNNNLNEEETIDKLQAYYRNNNAFVSTTTTTDSTSTVYTTPNAVSHFGKFDVAIIPLFFSNSNIVWQQYI